MTAKVFGEFKTVEISIAEAIVAFEEEVKGVGEIEGRGAMLFGSIHGYEGLEACS